MTIPTYMGLQTALSGLEAAQAAIDTTGQNISNASTPGYSRQTVNLTERSQLTIPALSSVTGDGSQFGTGVDITSITRIRDTFLDSQYRDANTTENGESTSSTILNQVQAGLDEPNASGLSGQLDTFFQDWASLGATPSSAGAQQGVIGQGQAVADQLNTLSGQLSTLESQVTTQYDTLTDPANGAVASDANQIAQLNGQIAQAQAAGINANSLEDQRDNVIDDLSQYSNVNVTTQSNGMVNVSFGNAAISAQSGGTDATPLVNGTSVDLTDNLTDSNLSGSGGTLGSLLGLYDSTTGTGQIATYSSTLDTVANQLATTVNSAIAGADSAGATAPPFFTGTTAATIAVNPAVTASATNPPVHGSRGERSRGLERRHRATVLQRVRHAGRQRRLLGPERPDDLAVAPHRDRQPAPERLRRLARRGDDQPHPVPAGLSGLRAGDEHDQRHVHRAARHGLGVI